MELDAFDLVGIAAALIAASLFIRYTHEHVLIDAAVLALAIAPFVIRARRRTRRRPPR